MAVEDQQTVGGQQAVDPKAQAHLARMTAKNQERVEGGFGVRSSEVHGQSQPRRRKRRSFVRFFIIAVIVGSLIGAAIVLSQRFAVRKSQDLALQQVGINPNSVQTPDTFSNAATVPTTAVVSAPPVTSYATCPRRTNPSDLAAQAEELLNIQMAAESLQNGECLGTVAHDYVGINPMSPSNFSPVKVLSAIDNGSTWHLTLVFHPLAGFGQVDESQIDLPVVKIGGVTYINDDVAQPAVYNQTTHCVTACS